MHGLTIFRKQNLTEQIHQIYTLYFTGYYLRFCHRQPWPSIWHQIAAQSPSHSCPRNTIVSEWAKTTSTRPGIKSPASANLFSTFWRAARLVAATTTLLLFFFKHLKTFPTKSDFPFQFPPQYPSPPFLPGCPLFLLREAPLPH